MLSRRISLLVSTAGRWGGRLRAKASTHARTGEEETPNGIFDSAGERLAGLSGLAGSADAQAADPGPADAEAAHDAPANLWDRVGERVAASKPAAMAERASLWEHLDQRLRLIKARPKLRDDLVVSQVEEAGTLYRVVKEPTSLNYYRFKENEYFILTLLDGNNEVRDLVRLYSQQYRPIRPETVQNFLDRAESFGLVARERASIYERLLRQMPAPMARLASALRFNFTLPDMDGFTQRLYHKTSFTFSKPMVMLWVGLALGAMLVVALNWSRLFREVGGALGSGWSLMLYLLVFYAGMAVVIVIHELAHTLTCVHYGGHVHKMGLMWFYVSLAAFADTSDAWLFPSRWARAWVSLAGPLSTLVCGALAVLIWQLATPGSAPARMAAMLILSTLPLSFANLNPFLEYDGYYVLTDLTGIVNLRKRSFAYTSATLRRLWQPEASLPATTPGQRRIFLSYGVLAVAYFVGLVLVPLGWQVVALLRRFGPLMGGLLAAGLLLLFGQRYIKMLYLRWTAKTHGRAP